MTKRLKVFVEAYECSPARGHAAGAAWQVLTRLSERHDLWVITEARYESEIARFVDTHNGGKSIHFTYLPRHPRRGPKGRRSTLPILTTLRYRGWLRRSYCISVGLHRRIQFDLTHHLRGSTFREPGYLWKLPVPFVWGPMGGSICLPWSMMSVLGPKAALTHGVKNMVTGLQFRFARCVSQAVRCANCILAQTSQDRNRLRKVHGVDAVVVHEQSAVLDAGFRRTFNGQDRLKIAWAGRCIPLKGLPILLAALQSPSLRDRVELHVAGDGPKFRDWVSLAGRLGVADACFWHGWCTNEAMRAMFNNCHVFAFPSLFDGTPAALMEALSSGLPAVCFDHCGMRDVVDETCGLKVPISSAGRATHEFSNALLRFIRQPGLVGQLSSGALARVHLFTWDRVSSTISDVYESLRSTA